MENNTFSFNVFNDYAKLGISKAIKKLNVKNLTPVFICIGSDLVLGDSLGPLVGTKLKENNKHLFVYGTLNYPVTAKEIAVAKSYIKSTHPNSIIIAIDAAIGEKDDVGIIKVMNRGLRPGLGVDKNLGTIGDISIIGVVSERSNKNVSLFNLTRLNLIYRMANSIAKGIENYVNEDSTLAI